MGSSFTGKPSKLIRCPKCKRFGLQGRFHKRRGIEIKCKKCNSFWDRDKALKLKQLWDKKKVECFKRDVRRYTSKTPYYKKYGL